MYKTLALSREISFFCSALYWAFGHFPCIFAEPHICLECNQHGTKLQSFSCVHCTDLLGILSLTLYLYVSGCSIRGFHYFALLADVGYGAFYGFLVWFRFILSFLCFIIDWLLNFKQECVLEFCTCIHRLGTACQRRVSVIILTANNICKQVLCVITLIHHCGCYVVVCALATPLIYIYIYTKRTWR